MCIFVDIIENNSKMYLKVGLYKKERSSGRRIFSLTNYKPMLLGGVTYFFVWKTCLFLFSDVNLDII